MIFTNILLVLIAVLLLARVAQLYTKYKNQQPKYQIGDRVRFVDASIFSDTVWIGTVWRVKKRKIRQPIYKVVWKCDPFSGTSYTVLESDIIELVERTNKSVANPFEPITKKVKIKNYYEK